MNPQPEEDWQRRLQQIEAEINSTSVDFEEPREKNQKSPSTSLNVKPRLGQLQLWFKNLNTPAKLIVVGVGLVLGFAMLQAVAKLVASLISVALLALLVYLGYKFFVSGSLDKNQ